MPLDIMAIEDFSLSGQLFLPCPSLPRNKEELDNHRNQVKLSCGLCGWDRKETKSKTITRQGWVKPLWSFIVLMILGEKVWCWLINLIHQKVSSPLRPRNEGDALFIRFCCISAKWSTLFRSACLLAKKPKHMCELWDKTHEILLFPSLLLVTGSGGKAEPRWLWLKHSHRFHWWPCLQLAFSDVKNRKNL